MFHFQNPLPCDRLPHAARFRAWTIVTSLAILACLIAGTSRQSYCLAADTSENSASSPDSLRMLVMDPLSKPLACDCVEGFAQRDYEALGDFLGKRLGKKVEVVFGESLTEALKKYGRIDLVIGKDSVVRYDADKSKRRYRPVAALTDKEGKTTFFGLFVVPTADHAKELADLARHRILFGPDCEIEKHGAAIDAIGKATGENIEVDQSNIRPSCAQSAIEAIETKDESPPTAAVISSYATPLLEGCGTIDPGSLRIIGSTKPVPFIVAFTDAKLDRRVRTEIRIALLAVADDPELCVLLESKSGFVAIKKPINPREGHTKKKDHPRK